MVAIFVMYIVVLHELLLFRVGNRWIEGGKWRTSRGWGRRVLAVFWLGVCAGRIRGFVRIVFVIGVNSVLGWVEILRLLIILLNHNVGSALLLLLVRAIVHRLVILLYRIVTIWLSLLLIVNILITALVLQLVLVLHIQIMASVGHWLCFKFQFIEFIVVLMFVLRVHIVFLVTIHKVISLGFDSLIILNLSDQTLVDWLLSVIVCIRVLFIRVISALLSLQQWGWRLVSVAGLSTHLLVGLLALVGLCCMMLAVSGLCVLMSGVIMNRIIIVILSVLLVDVSVGCVIFLFIFDRGKTLVNII